MENIKKKIIETYAHFVQDHGKEPSMSELLEKVGCSDDELHEHYRTLGGVRIGAWEYFAESTINRVQSEEVYEEYAVREKMLSFCYTLLEELKPFRGFVDYSFKHHAGLFAKPKFLKAFQAGFEPFAMELLAEGMDTGEVASRPIISDQYQNVLVGLSEFTVYFWLKDDSEGQEITDTAIEKSINFAFDFMAQGVFDSGFDLGKFLLQYTWEKVSSKK